MNRLRAFIAFIRRGPFYSYLADPKNRVNRRVEDIVNEPGGQAYIQLPGNNDS